MSGVQHHGCECGNDTRPYLGSSAALAALAALALGCLSLGYTAGGSGSLAALLLRGRSSSTAFGLGGFEAPASMRAVVICMTFKMHDLTHVCSLPVPSSNSGPRLSACSQRTASLGLIALASARSECCRGHWLDRSFGHCFSQSNLEGT